MRRPPSSRRSRGFCRSPRASAGVDKTQGNRHGVESFVVVMARREVACRDGRRTARAAAGIPVANFSLPRGTWTSRRVSRKMATQSPSGNSVKHFLRIDLPGSRGETRNRCAGWRCNVTCVMRTMPFSRTLQKQKAGKMEEPVFDT